MSQGQPIHEGRTAAAPSLAPLEGLLEPEYPEFWREMATGLYLELARSGELPALDVAARLAVAQTLWFVEMFGGHQHYIPTGRAVKDKAVVREVMEGFNGRNHVELGRRLGITSTRVYSILRDCGKDRAVRQAPCKPGVI